MTLETLTTINGYVARLERLKMLKSRTKSQNAQLYWVRAQLVDLGVEIK